MRQAGAIQLQQAEAIYRAWESEHIFTDGRGDVIPASGGAVSDLIRQVATALGMMGRLAR